MRTAPSIHISFCLLALLSLCGCVTTMHSKTVESAGSTSNSGPEDWDTISSTVSLTSAAYQFYPAFNYSVGHHEHLTHQGQTTEISYWIERQYLAGLFGKLNKLGVQCEDRLESSGTILISTKFAESEVDDRLLSLKIVVTFGGLRLTNNNPFHSELNYSVRLHSDVAIFRYNSSADKYRIPFVIDQLMQKLKLALESR